MLFEQQMAVVDQDGSVEGRFAIRAAGRQRNARQDCSGQIESGGSKLVDCRPAASEEAGFLKEVGGRIAADGQLGEDGQARAQIGSPAAEGHDFLQISSEIPDRRIDLGQCDLHISSLNGSGGERPPTRAIAFNCSGFEMSVQQADP